MGPVKAIDHRRMRDNFSTHAADYDRYAAVQKRVIGLLCEQLQHSEMLPGLTLDIGTGTGALAETLLEMRPESPLLLMDIAHGMTRAAARRLPQALASDGDARHLPFRDAVFQNIVSSSVYQWVDCLPTAFADVARVLRPEGQFGVALFGERTLYELRAAHRAAVAEVGAPRSSHVQSFPGTAEVAEALASAGLIVGALESCMEVDHHPDVPTLLRQLKQIGASNAAADRPRGFASRRVMQAMMRRYEEEHRTGEGVPASYEVIIAVARKSSGG